MQTIGDRITYCRSTIKATRKELAKNWGQVSVPTLSRWELDVIKPSPKKIEALANFFCSAGLIVSSCWIQSGSGMIPSLLDMKEFKEDEFDDICEQSFLYLNQKVKDFFYYKVTSNFFSPIIRYGDYVAGLRITANYENYLNTLVFAVQDNIVYVGFLGFEDQFFVKNSLEKKMIIHGFDLLAKIQWTAIRP